MDSMAVVWREQKSRFHSVTVEPLFKTLLLFLLKLYHRELKHTLTYRVVMSVKLRTVNIDFAKQTLICHEFITNVVVVFISFCLYFFHCFSTIHTCTMTITDLSFIVHSNQCKPWIIPWKCIYKKYFNTCRQKILFKLNWAGHRHHWTIFLFDTLKAALTQSVLLKALYK